LAVDGGLPQLRGRMGQVAPGVLQQLVVDDLDALLSDDLAGAVGGEEGVVALPYAPPAWLDRLPVLRAERWGGRPTRSGLRQRTQQALVRLWLAVDVDGEAVHARRVQVAVQRPEVHGDAFEVPPTGYIAKANSISGGGES
jgi:hypothetical protein